MQRIKARPVPVAPAAPVSQRHPSAERSTWSHYRQDLHAHPSPRVTSVHVSSISNERSSWSGTPLEFNVTDPDYRDGGNTRLNAAMFSRISSQSPSSMPSEYTQNPLASNATNNNHYGNSTTHDHSDSTAGSTRSSLLGASFELRTPPPNLNSDLESSPFQSLTIGSTRDMGRTANRFYLPRESSMSFHMDVPDPTAGRSSTLTPRYHNQSPLTPTTPQATTALTHSSSSSTIRQESTLRGTPIVMSPSSLHNPFLMCDVVNDLEKRSRTTSEEYSDILTTDDTPLQAVTKAVAACTKADCIVGSRIVCSPMKSLLIRSVMALQEIPPEYYIKYNVHVAPCTRPLRSSLKKRSPPCPAPSRMMTHPKRVRFHPVPILIRHRELMMTDIQHE